MWCLPTVIERPFIAIISRGRPDARAGATGMIVDAVPVSAVAAITTAVVRRLALSCRWRGGAMG
jgi:hypothetical protein